MRDYSYAKNIQCPICKEKMILDDIDYNFKPNSADRSALFLLIRNTTPIISTASYAQSGSKS